MNKPSDKSAARDETEAIAERAEWIKMACDERLRQVGSPQRRPGGHAA